MNKPLPLITPSRAFRLRLKDTVLAEFSRSKNSHHPFTYWLKWLIPAVSLASLILVKQSTRTTQINKLDAEMTTLEQQLLSDPQLDAAIDFQEL